MRMQMRSPTPTARRGGSYTRKFSSSTNLKTSAGRSRWSIDTKGLGAQQSYFGNRLSLFQPVIDVDVSQIETYSREVQSEIGKAMVKLAIEAREIARLRAPKNTGALSAGVYITGAPNASELKNQMDGIQLNQAKMLGHSSGYFKAITAAAKRLDKAQPDYDPDEEGSAIPGSESTSTEGLIHVRTQRVYPKHKITGDTVKDSDAFRAQFPATDERKVYREMNSALTFNPLGRVGQASFFVGLGSAMYYSAWVEYGTSRMRARPFFTAAAYYMTARAPGVMAEAIRNTKVKVTTRAPRSSKR